MLVDAQREYIEGETKLNDFFSFNKLALMLYVTSPKSHCSIATPRTV